VSVDGSDGAGVFPEPADQAVRRAALDPGGSFIVQAPAGSGKTGLLIQRYLSLLAVVDHPEEIVAITFTRKAAGEMRERVLDALAEDDGGDDFEGVPGSYQNTTRHLARAVRKRDEARSWSLAEQPSRLRILTIDALCRSIATQMPWSSGFGGDAGIVEDVTPLYAQAARSVVALLEDDGPWSEHLATLLVHLDGDVGRFESMLVEMLSRRDQWLRYLRPGSSDEHGWREELEAELVRSVGDELRALSAAVPSALAGELVSVCAFAGGNLAGSDGESPGAACAELHGLPGSSPADLPVWRGIARILLTGKGEWRKRLTRNEGFPPGKQPELEAMKTRARQLLAALSDAGEFCRRLYHALSLPEPAYTDAQWRVLNALLAILPVASASLRVVFAERGRVDYTEVTNAARQALGDEQAPTDLALALDYRIRHILVDEFQDTSHSHFALLTQLTAGWTPGDGRSVFLVGDPMQSIYRFREADVGLFLSVVEHGLSSVPLQSLRLGANFRSHAEIVDWVNEMFPRVMAARDDAVAGAVRYTPSIAHRDSVSAGRVQLLAFHDDDRWGEARRVAELVLEAATRDPLASIAILVRTRGHLEAILPALREKGIRYRGVDIESLAEVPVVEDLLALTRALLHPADRVAWLAILRAPWCGIELTDLHILAGGDRDTPVMDLLGDRGRLASMSGQGARRCAKLLDVLQVTLAERGRRSLGRWVEGTWTALGGPACVSVSDLANVDAFLELLGELDVGEGSVDGDELTRQVERLFAVSHVPEAHVEIMTVHKAKGLEFDTVIVPGLDRIGRHEARRLLAWTKRAGEPEDSNILLAPVPSPAEDEPPIYDYLYRLESEKADHERSRLLYVAATRARESLYLLARGQLDDDGGSVRKPKNGSLLESLWPALGDEFGGSLVAAPAPSGEAAEAGPEDGGAGLQRLPEAWETPAPLPALPPAGHAAAEPADTAGTSLDFDWAGETARHVGTVIHRVLRQLSLTGVRGWDEERLQRQRVVWDGLLAGLGIPPRERAPALNRVAEAIRSVLADPRGQWLLDPQHGEARSEYALSGIDEGALTTIVMDRTFVDDEGVRWIIDFKSGRHEGGRVAAFLDREQDRYRDQLERYGRMMTRMDQRPIRLALYFPVMAGWREWAYHPPSSES
jgi:ATP-dependent exoDNAse (exonuclease V) beta subunit